MDTNELYLLIFAFIVLPILFFVAVMNASSRKARAALEKKLVPLYTEKEISYIRRHISAVVRLHVKWGLEKLQVTTEENNSRGKLDAGMSVGSCLKLFGASSHITNRRAEGKNYETWIYLYPIQYAPSRLRVCRPVVTGINGVLTLRVPLTETPMTSLTFVDGFLVSWELNQL